MLPFFFFKCVIADKLSASLQNCSCNKISHLDSVERQRVKWTRLSPNIMVFIAVLCQNRLSGPSIFFFSFASYESPFLKLITMGSLETAVLSSCARVAGLFPRESIKKKVIPVCLPKTQTTLVAQSHFSHVPFPSFLLNTHRSPPTVVSATIYCH